MQECFFTCGNSIFKILCECSTHCLFWILLAVGSAAEDPLEVLVGHDQAGL